MTLLYVLALAALAIAVSPLLVKLIDRAAGWPLAGIFIFAAILLIRQLPDIYDGKALSYQATWVPDLLGPGLGVNFALKADALSVFFALLALLIGAVVFIYSSAYLSKNRSNTSFYTIMTAFTASILMLVLADDAFVLFIAWELVSLASFMLIARSGGTGGELGSQRTLILTFIGGLTMLSALAIAATQTGTTSISGILASDVWAEKPGLSSTIAVLIAVSAFTKSAQFPFHFWLPEAMAAATPVSAFLHAAAVVKAGIYLLMRFSTIFHDNATWNWLLIVVGIVTAVMASLFAIQKSDLKKLTAYSTVSHLGWIVATIGVGTPLALAAALVHTLAHAMFKSSLFMLIGVVDHQTGTRDASRLGSSWRLLPFTFGSVCIAAASMAAVPPTLGFISKEGMLAAFEEAPIGNGPAAILLIAAGIGALFTFTYSARIVCDGFIDGDRDMSETKEAPISLWLPAAIPGVLSLPIVFFVSALDKPISSAVAAVSEDPHTHLALWHGFNVPLAISIAVTVLGVVGIVMRKQIWAALDGRKLAWRSGNELLNTAVRGMAGYGKAVGKMADSLSPTRHLAAMFVLIIALGATVGIRTLISGGIDGAPVAPRVEGMDRWSDLVPLGIVALALVLLLRTSSRLTGVVLLGVAGMGVTFQMLTLGAPDVALTQLLVEALTVVIMMLVVRQQPETFHPTKPKRRIGAGVMAVLVGLVTFGAAYGLLGRRERTELSLWYLNNGPEITGGDNIVNTILVEFRAFDTLGELTVLGMAAVVIAAVVTSMPRYPFQRGTHPSPFGRARINAIPAQQLLRFLIPALAVVSFLVFMRGHNSPGGGFIAALIFGGALMISYISFPRDQRIVDVYTPAKLTGVGVLLALISGFIGLIKGSFLYALHGHFAGNHWTTSMIFDVGVYLAVMGMLSMAINVLGSYLRPGMSRKQLTFTKDNSPLQSAPEVSAREDDDPNFPDGKPFEHETATRPKRGERRKAQTIKQIQKEQAQ
ncbi:DUF4040 family protein [Corynebacterium pelargi]|uniref:Na(+)/H(+) antiporter subunit A n=1 Tax=Corynebacterium pelargi TaxID=1471400 RepID=A0A410WBI0_9CORY|nr:DUF4040 family protein [Corynebacterium pelargi]QAU53311.1 Na(+)/H(+) antiporter subunit A [Corynebacterium pelargi]GGG73374.1 monovalent cation/H+ antiporter subunit A [Corynebacterium pelargi]